jgi:hypothetical protein
MPTKAALRKIEGFHLNVHVGDDPLQDYSLLAQLFLADTPHKLTSARRQLAFHVSEENRILFFLSYEGDPEAEALLYDMGSGTERLTPRRSGEIVATRTHFAVNLAARVVAFEHNQRGTKREDFEDLVVQLIHKTDEQNQSCDVSLVPIPKPSFLQELREYDRIQSAKVLLVRSNPGWLDADSPLLKYADRSDAQAINLEARAKRNRSLSRREGIIGDLRKVVGQGITTVREAVIWGNEHGSKQRRETKLSSHALSTVVSLERMADGQPNHQMMKEHVLQYCAWLSENHPIGEEQ